MKRRTPLLFLLLIPWVSGCQTGPVAGMGLPFALDGEWQNTSTGRGFGIACITIANNTIIQVVDGCTGQPSLIITGQPAAITPTRVVLVFGIQTPTAGLLAVTLDLTPQPDGSLVGTETVRNATNGNTTTDNVILTRL